jgi:hypothetical protein
MTASTTRRAPARPPARYACGRCGTLLACGWYGWLRRDGTWHTPETRLADGRYLGRHIKSGGEG